MRKRGKKRRIRGVKMSVGEEDLTIVVLSNIRTLVTFDCLAWTIFMR